MARLILAFERLELIRSMYAVLEIRYKYSNLPSVKSFSSLCWTLKRFTRRVASGGQGGQCPPIFVFDSPPPIYFLPSTVFFGEEKVAVFGRKKRLNFLFRPEKALDFGENLFLRSPELFKFVFSARKSLRISAKTFFFFFF